MHHARTHVLRTASAVALLVGPVHAQINDFEDLDWTFTGPSTSSGEIDDEVMVIWGPDYNCQGNNVALFTTVAPVSGTVRATLYWTKYDSWALSGHANFDWPLYEVDGEATKIGTSGLFTKSWYTGVYDVSFEVLEGQEFGLGVEASDCAEGPGLATFFDLELLPEPWVDLGHGLDPSVDLVVPEPAGSSLFARAVVSLGDVNADGIPDLASAAPISVASGLDGTVLWSEADVDAEDLLLRNAGDVDGDGVDDLAVAQDSAPTIRMYSGADGTELWSWTAAPDGPYGTALASFGDLDGDGVRELAVGADEWDSLPVQILAGASGAMLPPIVPAPELKRFGAMLAAVGDLDQDSVVDLGIYARYAPLQVHSGATGLLDRELGFFTDDMPADIQGAGDWDGDGQADIAVGRVPLNYSFKFLPGTVEVWSGSDGAVLLDREGVLPYSRFGSSLAGDLDLDGDGRPELAVAAGGQISEPHIVPGHVLVLSAPDGDVVREYLGEEDLAVNGIAWNPHPTGPRLAFAVDSAPGGQALRVYSDFDHVGTPRLELYGPVGPSAPQLMSIEGAVPNGVVVLVLGLSQIDLPLQGGVLVPSLDVTKAFAIDAQGDFDLSDKWPAYAPQDLDVWSQAWMLDPDAPFGFAATNAVRTP